MEIRERLAVKEWHGSAEPPKSDEGLERRAELARATPPSNPKSEETKRRVFGVFGGTHDFGVFLAVPLPSAENRAHIQKFSFPRSSSCVLYPRHTSHIRASAFPFTLAKTIAPYQIVHYCVCVFPNSPVRFHGATELRTLHLNFPDLLSFVSAINWEYDNPESEPKKQDTGDRNQAWPKVARSTLCSAFPFTHLLSGCPEGPAGTGRPLSVPPVTRGSRGNFFSFPAIPPTFYINF